MPPTTISVVQVEDQAPGGVHGNASTFSPPVSQNQRGNDSDDGSGSSSTIIVGVVVPLVIIGIIALAVYIWYRKKYPVRMVIGKDFSTFSNPAYNKRASTLTLVRDDGNKVFEQLGQRNSVIEEETEGVDERDGQDNRGFEPESPVYENTRIAPPPEPTQQTEKQTQVETTVPVVTEPNIVRERPRKRALLVKQEDLDEFDNGFELVTEADLGIRRPSEISVGNDSTDTRTISLSFSETFDDNHRKARSHSEDMGLFQSSVGIDTDKNNINGKARSNSDSVRSPRNRNSQDVTPKWQSSDLKSLPIAEKTAESDEDEFVKLEQAVMKMEQGDTESIPDNIIREVSLLSNEDIEYKLDNADEQQDANNEVKFGSGSDDSFEVLDQTEKMNGDSDSLNNDGDANNENASFKHGMLPDNDSQSADNGSGNTGENRRFSEEVANNHAAKRLSLQLSSENIVLDDEPPTATVIVPDSIIFEPETPNPIHLDRTVNSPRRGRRAFTLNDIVFKTDKSTGSIEGTDEISKSSPEISLEQEHSHSKEITQFVFESDTLKQAAVTLSDSKIDRSFDESSKTIKTAVYHQVEQEYTDIDKENEQMDSLFPMVKSRANTEIIPAISSDESDTDSSVGQVTPSDLSSENEAEIVSKPTENKQINVNVVETSIPNNPNQSENRKRDGGFLRSSTPTSTEHVDTYESVPSSPDSEIVERGSVNKESRQFYEDSSSESSIGPDIEKEIMKDIDETEIENMVDVTNVLSADTKKKIISASFTFDMDADDDDDDSDDEKEDSNSTVDSNDFSIISKVPKEASSTVELGGAVSLTGIDVDEQSDINIMTYSNDSNMSWELLNKSPDSESKPGVDMPFSFDQNTSNQSDQEKSGNGPETPLSESGETANISWEVLEGNEDNSEC